MMATVPTISSLLTHAENWSETASRKKILQIKATLDKNNNRRYEFFEPACGDLVSFDMSND